MQIECDSDIYTEERYGYGEKRGTAVIRLFGVTSDSNSVLCIVEDFQPYFYFKCPQISSPEVLIDALTREFTKIIQEKGNLNNQSPVTSIEVVERTDFMYYNDRKEKFYKATLKLPKYVSICRDFIQNGLSISNIEVPRVCFESKLNFQLRFMIDQHIVGMSWVECPAGKYKVTKNKTSNCQLEIAISYKDLIAFSAKEKPEIAPIRIFSFDIECLIPSRDERKEGDFFAGEIIQIGCITKILGAEETLNQTIYTQKSCAPILNADIRSFETERELLDDFANFFLSVDPDIIIGYNINGFDIPYLLNRAERHKLESFPYLTRIRDIKSKVTTNSNKAKSFGNREFTDINMEGRIILDMYIHILREHKLRSYSLNNVSYHFLGEQKEDVRYSMIRTLYQKDEFTRRRLCTYCLKDAYLPLRLLEKLMVIYNYTEMCRVCCTPLSFILTRGQQIKVLTQLHSKALEAGFLIPNVSRPGNDSGFEGAYVIEPKRGFYNDPIVTLDFASLYPSIMLINKKDRQQFVLHNSNPPVTYKRAEPRHVHYYTQRFLLPKKRSENWPVTGNS